MVLCFSVEIVMSEERANNQETCFDGNICFHPHNDLFSVKTTRTHNLSSGLIPLLIRRPLDFLPVFFAFSWLFLENWSVLVRLLMT